MQKKLITTFFKLIIFIPVLIIIKDSSFINFAKSEVSQYSKKTLQIFGRYDFQYEKWREYTQKYRQSEDLEDLYMSCEYARRANKILINNYSHLTRETPGVRWPEYRAMWKEVVMICDKNDY
tara:strand:- start:425 stop:790 length:366 start_codon:yes stop_codon:yes gene_type:complete